MTTATAQRIHARKKMRKQRETTETSSIFFDLPKGLVVIAIIMISAQVLLSNIVGVKGAELVTFEESKNALIHEKLVLENEISKLSSLTRIEEVSREKLSMQPADTRISYVERLSVADAR